MTGASALTFVAAVLAVTGLADLLAGARAGGRSAARAGGSGRAARAGERTPERGGPGRAEGGEPAAKRTAPRLLRALARLGRRLKPAGAPAPRDLEARIAAAGRPGGSGLAR